MGSTLSYVDYDFDLLVLQMQNRLKASSAWKDAYRSGTGQMLVEFYAYIANMILFYIERRAEESYITTAKNKSSVVNLVRLLGYIPKRNVSSIGTVTFSIPVAHTKNIYFPKYTVLESTGGVPFVVSQDAVLLAGALSVDASIIQGTNNVVSITADGTINQDYLLNYTDIENTNLTVSVNGVTWTPVTSFLSGTPTSQWYEVRYELDDTVTIVFGDNINGQAPASGAAIIITFIRSLGASGNIYSTNAVTTLSSFVYDSDGTRITTATVTNSDVIIGGDDAESIEEIRDEAPRVFATGDRAVTRDDYRAILDNYASIATSNAWGENEENPPNYVMFNRVKLSLILEGWDDPSTDFKTTLSAYLKTKAQLTVKYTYVDAVILDAVLSLVIKVKSEYTLGNVQSAVEDALTADFTLGTTTKLGISKRYSDMVAAVEAVAGVAYHYLTVEITKNLVLGYDLVYDYGEILDAVPLTATKAKLYLTDTVGAVTQLAVDDGANGWTNLVGTGYIVTGVINYTTGVTGVNITPALSAGDTLSVLYTQDEKGDIVVNEYQIARLSETIITSITYES